MTYYIYFLWSGRLKKIYIGISSDVTKRLQAHNAGRQRYTKRGIPWTLVGIVPQSDKKTALKEERRLKKSKNRDYYRKYLLSHGYKCISSEINN